MPMWSSVCRTPAVALLAEGVDRNLLRDVVRRFEIVALLAEGVDRNFEVLILAHYVG